MWNQPDDSAWSNAIAEFTSVDAGRGADDWRQSADQWSGGNLGGTFDASVQQPLQPPPSDLFSQPSTPLGQNYYTPIQAQFQDLASSLGPPAPGGPNQHGNRGGGQGLGGVMGSVIGAIGDTTGFGQTPYQDVGGPHTPITPGAVGVQPFTGDTGDNPYTGPPAPPAPNLGSGPGVGGLLNPVNYPYQEDVPAPQPQQPQGPAPAPQPQQPAPQQPAPQPSGPGAYGTPQFDAYWQNPANNFTQFSPAQGGGGSLEDIWADVRSGTPAPGGIPEGSLGLQHPQNILEAAKQQQRDRFLYMGYGSDHLWRQNQNDPPAPEDFRNTGYANWQEAYDQYRSGLPTPGGGPAPPPGTPGAPPSAPPPDPLNTPFNLNVPGTNNLGLIPGLSDFLTFMSYSSPTQQAIKAALEASGLFDDLAPYLLPGATPSQWSMQQLGDYGPLPGQGVAGTPGVAPEGQTPFTNYNPTGLLELLKEAGLISGGGLSGLMQG